MLNFYERSGGAAVGIVYAPHD